MKSFRLTNENRSDIKNILSKPLKAEVLKRTEKWGEYLQKLIIDNTPEELLITRDHYPQCLKITSYIDCSLMGVAQPLRKQLHLESCYIKVEWFIEDSFSFEDLQAEEKNSIIDYAKALGEAQFAYRQMCNKLDCALENYRTSNQLKNDFPEAYNALLQSYNIIGGGKSRCDNVENLRAELNQLKNDEAGK